MKDSTRKQIEGNWDQFSGSIKKTWGKVTDDDLTKAEGRAEQLVGVIKERTGEEEAKIESRLDELASKQPEGTGRAGRT